MKNWCCKRIFCNHSNSKRVKMQFGLFYTLQHFNQYNYLFSSVLFDLSKRLQAPEESFRNPLSTFVFDKHQILNRFKHVRLSDRVMFIVRHLLAPKMKQSPSNWYWVDIEKGTTRWKATPTVLRKLETLLLSRKCKKLVFCSLQLWQMNI